MIIMYNYFLRYFMLY